MGIIKRQGIYNTVLSYVGVVIGFANILVIQPLFLSTEEIGLVRVLYSFSVLMASLMPLGITNATTRFFPVFRNPDNRHAGYFGFMLLFPVVGYLLLGGGIFVFKDFFVGQYAAKSPLFVEYFNYVFPLSLSLNLISVFNVYCFAHFRTSVPVFLQDIFTRVCSILIVSAYFVRLIDLDMLVTSVVGIYALQLVLLTIYMLRFDRPALRFDRTVITPAKQREVMRYALLFSFAALASMGLKQLDVVMLGRKVDLALVGVYGVVATIPAVIEGPIFALEKILSATMSDAIQHRRWDEVRRMYTLSSRYLLLIGGLFFLGINLSVHDLLTLMPEEYMAGRNVVYILSAGVLFNMATGSNTTVLFYSEHYRAGLAMLLGLIVLAFGTNIVLIPMFGLEGAALATVSSLLLFNLMKFGYIWKEMKMQPFDGRTFRNVMLIVLCLLIIFVPLGDGSAVWRIVVRSVLIAGTYLAGVHFLRIAPELLEEGPVRTFIDRFKGK
ncbi:MAG: polysaccharide biosynthesis C-terminal domain-containing protein [Flavobacteriales bacterium]|nr:polysaccharide biosynthesis C-terminal domain-containing protein [Flavobacteriales bacterium]